MNLYNELGKKLRKRDKLDKEIDIMVEAIVGETNDKQIKTKFIDRLK